MAGRRLLTAGLVFLLCVSSAACGRQEAPPALLDPPETLFDTAVVQRGDLSRAEYYDAYVAMEIDELSFPLAGTVGALNVALGDRVHAGDVVAELDTGDIDRAMEDVQKSLNSYYASYAYRLRQYEYTKTEQELRRNEATGGRTLAAMDADIAAREAASTALESEIAALEESVAAKEARVAELEDALEAARDAAASVPEAPEDGGTEGQDPGTPAPSASPAPDPAAEIAALEQALEEARGLLAAEQERLEGKKQEQERAVEELEKLKSDRLLAEELDLALAQTASAMEYLDANYWLQQSYYSTTLEELEAQRESCFLKAPRDGVVTGITLPSIGTGVGMGTIVMRIAADDTCYVRYDSGANLARRTSRAVANIGGQIWDLELIAYSDAELRAFMTANQTPPARFRFVQRGISLQAGQYAQLTLFTMERRNVLYVPRGALYMTTGGSNGYVYRIVDGEKEYTDVTYGLVTDSWAEILTGLEEGEVVYVG